MESKDVTKIIIAALISLTLIICICYVSNKQMNIIALKNNYEQVMLPGNVSPH